MQHRGAPRFWGNATMNHNHGRSITEPGGIFLLQVFQRVLGLGEDQYFLPQPGCRIEYDRFVKDRFKLAPLCVLPDSFRRSARLRDPSKLRFRLRVRQGSAQRSPDPGFSPRLPLLRRRELRRCHRVVSGQLWRVGERDPATLPQELLFAKPLLSRSRRRSSERWIAAGDEAKRRWRFATQTPHFPGPTRQTGGISAIALDPALPYGHGVVGKIVLAWRLARIENIEGQIV